MVLEFWKIGIEKLHFFLPKHFICRKVRVGRIKSKSQCKKNIICHPFANSTADLQ